MQGCQPAGFDQQPYQEIVEAEIQPQHEGEQAQLNHGMAALAKREKLLAHKTTGRYDARRYDVGRQQGQADGCIKLLEQQNLARGTGTANGHVAGKRRPDSVWRTK